MIKVMNSKKAVIKFAFEAEEKNEITVAEGEIVNVLEVGVDGWSTVQNNSGKTGLVPSNYYEIIVTPEVEQEPKEKTQPVVTAPPTSSSAAPTTQFIEKPKLPAGKYYIRSRHNGLYLDVKGASKSNGAYIILWKFTGASNQQWELSEKGTIKSLHSGLYLDVKGVTGTYVIVYEGNNQANQKWSYDEQGHIISEVKNHYLDVKGESKTPGEYAIVWPKNGKLNQEWDLLPVSK